MSPTEASGRVVLALVIAAHGTRGELRLKSFAANPAAIAGYGPLERSDGGPPLKVLSVRPAKGGLIVRFAAVSDRNAAESLKGVELSVARHLLPEPGHEEFYYADLVGLAAERPDGAALGEVVAVHNFGAGDLLELRLPDGLQTVLVPFTREAVPEVDVAARRIVVDPPEGLLDE